MQARELLFGMFGGKVPLCPGNMNAGERPYRVTRVGMVSEVMAGARSHQLEDALESRLFGFGDGELGRPAARQRGQPHPVPGELAQPHGELAHRQHQIGNLRGDHGARHAVVGRLARVLHQHEPARLLHGLGSQGPIRAAGEHDGEAVTVARRERAEKRHR